MRDLPMSLWFKYHFGVMKQNPIDEPPSSPISGYLSGTTTRSPSRYCGVSASQTLSPTITKIEVEESAYDAAPNAGICEIWVTQDSSMIYKRASTFKEKFIYEGKTTKTQGGIQRWYLIGVKHINGTYAINASHIYSEGGINRRVFVRFPDYEDDYKHIWLLWSDMRNNGEANADGSERKAEFGLQYPLYENYDFDLYFADQVDADGNIDKFGSLRAGEDLDVWSVDATTDPFTGGAFSKPIDYSTPQDVGYLSLDGGKLKIGTGETGTVAVGDYI